jgi:hypothetical protein
MKKEYLSPILNMLAMALIIISKLSSNKGLDWVAIGASLVFVLSTVHLISLLKKSNNLK